MNILISILLILFCNISLSLDNETGAITGLPLPRYVSLKSYETNLRKGPGSNYPIVWTYKQKGYPMQVVAEFEQWRKLKDKDGEEGWVRENLISGNRNVVIIGNKIQKSNYEYQLPERESILFYHPSEDSYPVARVELNVIGKIKKCNEEWCLLKIDRFSGWIRKVNLWGIGKEEIIK
jgi:SH3-like domain-containing protein